MRIPGGSSVVLGAEDDVVPAGHGRPGALGAADPTARARTTIAVLLAVLRLVLGLILREAAAWVGCSREASRRSSAAEAESS